MNKIKAAAIAAIFLALVGCGTVNENIAPFPTVTCPPMPTLPKVYASELQSLTDDAYRRLVERELRLREHIGQLRSVCHDF